MYTDPLDIDDLIFGEDEISTSNKKTYTTV